VLSGVAAFDVKFDDSLVFFSKVHLTSLNVDSVTTQFTPST